MRTYRDPLRGRVRELRFLTSLVLLVACASGAAAQQRKYLIELGAAGSYLSPADTIELGGATGGLARLGLWLPANFSLELEGSTHSSTANVGGTDVGIKTFTGSALYNFLVGQASTIYLKAGAGSTKYGSDCPGQSEPGVPYPCGSSGALLFGAGGRIALTPTLMVRTEGQYVRNSSGRSDRSFWNLGVNLGLSLMLGSKPIDDSDGDGVLNNRDRCADTPSGAQVDSRGCPSDDDNDGVPNGVDRCTTTAVGATVDSSGCTRDSDGDNIADGLDRCPETPTGVLVDPTGCPRDSDGDAIADGLDRCSDTPKGATVDALGCPGDEDGDGVLDGLDRCPRSPVGARVATNGCAPGQTPGRQEQAPTPTGPPPAAAAPAPTQPAPTAVPRTPTTPSQVQPSDSQQGPPPATRDTAAPKRRPAGGIRAGVIPDVGFVPGTARLTPASYTALDSIVTILLANPSLRIEVAAHTDNAASASENMHLTNLQAEAVRNYLVTKGVPFQQVVPRGYGATVPLTADTTPRGRAANRRVEIRATQAGP